MSNRTRRKNQRRLAKRRREKVEKVNKTKPLPIEKDKQRILDAVKNNQVVIVIGNTGCGKSTQIPQMLFEAGYANDGIIACTQPRRIAAWSLAKRVAAEMGCDLGTQVGYKVRFEDYWDHTTKILYVTDGSLVRACPGNLKLYSVIVLDEVHERSLQTDVLFGLLKKTLQKRNDLRVILSSATINAEKLSTYFNKAPILEVKGTLYEVKIIHRPVDRKDYLNAVANTIKEVARQNNQGDILAFLPGKFEIEQVHHMLRYKGNFHLVHAHAELSSSQLKKIHKPAPQGMRKIVLSTNMAETSLTIEGVVFIIDSGYVKRIEYDGKTGVNHLKKVWCSRAEADQRKGRAGRTQKGYCYRLYSEEVFNKDMPDIPPPEVTRLDLSSMVLQLKEIGYHHVQSFDFIEKPNLVNLKAAHDHLHRLRALDSKCQLTERGRQLAAFPLEPKLAAALISASELGCVEQVLMICSIMSAVTGPNVFKLSPLIRENQLYCDPMMPGLGDFVSHTGDTIAIGNILEEFMSYDERDKLCKMWCKREALNFMKMREATWVFQELKATMERLGLPTDSYTDDEESVATALLEGAFYDLADGFGRNLTLMRKNGGSATVQSPLTHPSIYFESVFGLDLMQMGNSPQRVLTCVTRVPESTDLNHYRQRMAHSCAHVKWPDAEKQKETSKTSGKASTKKKQSKLKTFPKGVSITGAIVQSETSFSAIL